MSDPDVASLFSEHSQALYGFLAYRVGDPALAEDLLGDTFERVVRARRRYDRRKGSEKTWIYTIALNCLRDHARRAKTELNALGAHAAAMPAGDDALGRVEDRDVVSRALGELGAPEREVVALRYGADLRAQEIAQILGVPTTTVNGRLYSGLSKLRTAMQPRPAAAGLG